MGAGMLQLLSFLPTLLPLMPSNSRLPQTNPRSNTNLLLPWHGERAHAEPSAVAVEQNSQTDTASTGISRRKILFTSFEQQHSGGHSLGRSCRSKRGGAGPHSPPCGTLVLAGCWREGDSARS